MPMTSMLQPQAVQHRQRRQTNAQENLILKARQDDDRRISRNGQRNGQAALQRTFSVHSQDGALKRQKSHRRTMSVPDNVLMNMVATAPVMGRNAFQAGQLPDLNFDVSNVGSERRQQAATMNTITTTINNNNQTLFIHEQQQQSNQQQRNQNEKKTSSNEGVPRYYAVTPQDQYAGFPQTPRNADQLLDELLGMTPVSRRGSAVSLQSPMQTEFSMEQVKPEALQLSQSAFPLDSQLPTPPNTAPIRPVSTFDLAPLPHPNFVNLASLSMPLEGEGDNFSESSSANSPCETPGPSPTTKSFGLFETSPSVPQTANFKTTLYPTIFPKMPESSFAQHQQLVAQKRAISPAPQPLGSEATGISMEEIHSFISGPEEDGKWVCLYPECKKRFGRKENIKSHVQTHLGDRQYRCEVCKKCFVRQHDLKRHAKIHTGIKPYPCLCGNSFARHDALTRHRQRGVCVGSFEGIIKKSAKRGRPRKRPRPEDEDEDNIHEKKFRLDEDRDATESAPESVYGSSSSSQASDTSDPRSPTAINELGSPPNYSFQYSASEKEMSPGPDLPSELSPHMGSSSVQNYNTPPTSPPEFYDIDTFMPQDKRNSVSFSEASLADEEYATADYSTSLPQSEEGVKMFNPLYNPQEQFSPRQEDFMFSEDAIDILSLSALDKEAILTFDDFCAQPELLST